MNMKKITSLLMALVMVFSMSTVAFATDDDYETLVSYTGDGESIWEVTVPATLAPGGSGKVKVSGTWASNMTVNVTAPETVTLTNDIDGSTKTLDVEFDGISQAGDNTNSILVNATISVEEITNALFGTWTGTIVYTVSTEEDESASSGTEATLITFTIDGTEYNAEECMTWTEWIDSKYNTLDVFLYEYDTGKVYVGDWVYISEANGEVPYLCISSDSGKVYGVEPTSVINSEEEYYIVDSRSEWTDFYWYSLIEIDGHYLAFDPLALGGEGSLSWINQFAHASIYEGAYHNGIDFRIATLDEGVCSNEIEEQWFSSTYWFPWEWYENCDAGYDGNIESTILANKAKYEEVLKNQDILIGIYDSNTGETVAHYLCYKDGTHVKYGDDIVEFISGGYTLTER